MYHFGQENPSFLPQQERPNARSNLTHTQPRRPLAINDMLNHGAPPWSSRDTRLEIMFQPRYGHRIAESTSYLPPLGHYQPPSLPPPTGSQTPVPQPYHSYPPGTTYRPPFHSTTGHMTELPAPPPIGTREQRWDGDYYMSHFRTPVPPTQCRFLALLNLPIEPYYSSLDFCMLRVHHMLDDAKNNLLA
jgi:hypothetical protein